MSYAQVERRFPRLRVPAWVECPALAEKPILVEDISAGGFEASVGREPLEGIAYGVSLRVGEARFGPFQALVAWSREGGPAGMWAFGMLVVMSDDRREELAAVLDSLNQGQAA